MFFNYQGLSNGGYIMDQLHTIVLMVGRIFHNIWSYNLVSVSGNHIRVSNIVLAIILLLIGIKYSKNFANLIKNYIRDKVKYDKDAINALEKLALYIALCLYVITILEIANVPLSTFAFVGGALAIVIGLGAQTLISNFISSLVIMVERPIKIGDVVEIEGVIGTVRSVGARCIIITTLSNVDVLIPNSKLMQNTLVNWTLSDNKVKHQVEITVPKDPEKQLNPQYFINDLKRGFKNLESTFELINPEILLIRIEHCNLVFLINFYCDVEQVENPEYVRNIVNLALMNNLKDYNFSAQYLKVVNVQPLNEKDEK